MFNHKHPCSVASLGKCRISNFYGMQPLLLYKVLLICMHPYACTFLCVIDCVCNFHYVTYNILMDVTSIYSMHGHTPMDTLLDYHHYMATLCYQLFLVLTAVEILNHNYHHAYFNIDCT